MIEFNDKLLMFNKENDHYEFIKINPDNQEVYSDEKDP